MIETKTIPVAPFKGLYLDGQTPPGGMSKANNVFILPDGSVERRLFQRTLDESPACLASRGLKNVYELRKSDGTRYLFADVDNSDTKITSFGVQKVDGFASWNAVSGWAFGTGKWTHTTGTTALTSIITATPDFVVVPTTQYRIVADVACAAPSESGTYWAYTSVDSTFKWHDFNDDPGTEGHIIWSNKWTHSNGGTTALKVTDFTPVAGQSYRVSVYITHTSGTGVEVFLGGKSGGVISSTGQHELIFTFVTDTTALRFVPSSDWVGVIESTTPIGAMAYSRPDSVKKLIDPAGANIPSNLDDELLNVWGLTNTWYPEAAASTGQSLAIYLGGTLAGVIQASGEYTFDVVAATAADLTFTPTTAWAGSVNGVSVMTTAFESTASIKMKVIGGTVTGTTDYETSWGNVVTNLVAGDNVWPMWATMQDKAYRVDGTNINYYFNDVSEAHTLGVPAPAEVPMTASATSGELVAGAYNVYYAYVKKEGDRYTEGNPSPASNVTIAGNAITVNVIANTDPDITHIRIYRTLSAELGSPAMRAIEVLNATQTVTLSLADDIIGDGDALEYNHDMPNRAMFVLVGGSRLWMLRFPGEVGGDSLLTWSEVGLSEYFPSKNSQTFDPDDGDKCMGMALLKDNLLIFKRHKTYIINMYSFGKDIISPTIGCIASGSIQSVGVNSAIWLSSEGIMLYDGGEPRNISKFKINSVINFFMANGAEPYIDSCYHSTKRQYHINFLYRTGNVITAQRHFVYALDSDAWTEYVYTSDGGVRYYEINFCLASDSNLNEVILIPYLTSTTGTVAYIYQTDYEATPSTSTSYEYSVYRNAIGDITITKDLVIYYPPKQASLWVNLFISSNRMASFTTISAANLDNFYGPTEILNLGNGIYLAIGANGLGVNSSYAWIVRSTDYGATWTTVLKENTYGAAFHISYAVNMGDGNILTGNVLLANETTVSYKSADYGLTWTPTVYTENYFDPLTYAGNNIVLGNGAGGSIGHIMRSVDGGTTWTDLGLIISDPITHAAEAVSAIGYLGNGIALAGNSASDTREIYRSTDYGATWTPITVSPIIYGVNRILNIGNGIALIGGDSTSGSIYRTTDYGLTWVNVKTGYFITELSYAGYGIVYAGIKFSEILYSNDYGLTWDTHNATTPGGLTYIITPIVSETTVVYSTAQTVQMDNTYTLIPATDDSYWEIVSDTISNSESAPTMSGVIVDIVSNYEDLGMSNDKRVKRMYLDVESQYATCGYATIEPDYGVNKYVHVNNETTEPTGATSLRPFAHPGRQTWDYTNDQFDSNVENWQDTRLDLGTQGKKFRYSIKIGDTPSANHGILRLRPPKIDIQMLGKK